MRPKIVLAILLPAILVISAVFLLKPHPAAPLPAPAPAPVATAAPVPPPPPAPAPAPVAVKTPTPEERQAAIDAETDRLAAWSMNNDPQSLSNILNDLNSPEKEIRKAAIEAAKQFESTNAIPALKAAAASVDDTEDAVAMLEAAEWLALPSADFSRPATMPQLTPEQQQAIEQDKAKAQQRRQDFLQRRAAMKGLPGPSQSTAGQNTSGNTGQ